MKRIETFSAYMLKTWEECKRKFYFSYVLKIFLPSVSSAAQSGEKIHILTNYFLKRNDIERMKKSLSEKELALWEKVENHELLKNELLASEYEFNLRLGNFWANGRIDAIFKDEKKIIIADWKTGASVEESSDFQSKLYLIAVYEIFKSKKILDSPEQLEFWYVYLNSNETQKIHFTEKKYNLFKEEVYAKMNEIDDFSCKGLPEMSQFTKCYACNLKTLCYNYSNQEKSKFIQPN